MIHFWRQTIDLPDGREVGVCSCGWNSNPRWREDGGRHAVKHHAERQQIFDTVGKRPSRAKKYGTFYEGVAAA